MKLANFPAHQRALKTWCDNWCYYMNSVSCLSQRERNIVRLRADWSVVSKVGGTQRTFMKRANIYKS